MRKRNEGTPANAPSALLIVDMISSWDFADAEKLIAGANDIAPRIARLKARCHRADVPVIYANDNLGQWRSDFSTLIEKSLEPGGQGASITQTLLPHADDYFVLKPKHSAFFSTPMELLLDHLRVRRVIVTGVSSDQCVLATAIEARMRDLEVLVPSDCVASQTDERNRRVLWQLEEVYGIKTTPSEDIDLTEQVSDRESRSTTVG